ncbi:hypothetical protein EJB05_46958, partial [Eragrostis curvula]
MLPICTLQGPQQVDTVEGRKMVSEPLSPQNQRCKDVLHILAEIRLALDLQVEFESFAEKQNYFQVRKRTGGGLSLKSVSHYSLLS